jgi:hypothetical protein
MYSIQKSTTGKGLGRCLETRHASRGTCAVGAPLLCGDQSGHGPVASAVGRAKRCVAREDRERSLDNAAMQLGDARAMAPRWGGFGSETVSRRSQCLVSRPHATLTLHSSAQITQASAHGQNLSQVRKRLDWPVRLLVIVAAIIWRAIVVATTRENVIVEARASKIDDTP